MSYLISHDDLEFLLEKAIKKKTNTSKKQYAIAKLLHKANNEGSSFKEIYYYTFHKQVNTSDNRDKKPEEDPKKREREVWRIINGFNNNLEIYYNEHSKEAPYPRIRIAVFKFGNESYARLENMHPIINGIYLERFANNNYDYEFIKNETTYILGKRPGKLDYIGSTGNNLLNDSDFIRMVNDMIDAQIRLQYRFLILDPDEGLAPWKDERYREIDPPKAKICSKIRSSIDAYHTLREIIGEEQQECVQMKLTSFTPFRYSRLTILHGDCVHFRITQPKEKMRSLRIYSHNSDMYDFATNAFDAMWEQALKTL